MSRWVPVLFSLASAACAADVDIAAQYSDRAKQLIAGARADSHSLDRLEYLCDRIGNRLSGSSSLNQAISWAAGEMKSAGLQNVRTATVKVPHWARGAETATILDPINRRLPILGLGNSVGTPAGGITAEVVAVSTFDELSSLKPEQIQWKNRSLRRPLPGLWAHRNVPGEWCFTGCCPWCGRSSGPFRHAD